MAEERLQTVGKVGFFPLVRIAAGVGLRYTQSPVAGAGCAFSQLAQTVVHMGGNLVAKSHHHVNQWFDVPPLGEALNGPHVFQQTTQK